MAKFKFKKMTFIEYIGSKFRLPSKAHRITGTVIIQFIIDLDGTVTNVEVLQSLGSGIDEEAIRVVKNSPKWIPAQQGGKTVRLRMKLPIKVGI